MDQMCIVLDQNDGRLSMKIVLTLRLLYSEVLFCA